MQHLRVVGRWLCVAIALMCGGAAVGLLGCAAEEERELGASGEEGPTEGTVTYAREGGVDPLLVDGAWVSLEDRMSDRRYGHTATRLNDGRVLVVGGMDETGSPHSSVDLFDPADRSWTRMASSPQHARTWHTATLLRDGRVLVVGGADPDAPPELFDPDNGRWTATPSIDTPPMESPITMGMSATLLGDGRVLVAGGWSYSGSVQRAQLFDPASDTWSVTRPMSVFRCYHSATLLHDGRVLVAGGSDNQAPLSSAELFDPELERWEPAGEMETARQDQTATRLQDGSVLVAGGQGDFRTGYTKTAELYRPSFNSWRTTVLEMNTARFGHSATLLHDGRVLIAGGGSGEIGYVSSAELFDPVTESWAFTDSMSTSRGGHTATRLAEGPVLITGGLTTNGENESEYLDRAELFDTESPMWTRAKGQMNAARFHHSATRLPDGRVLVAGGEYGGSAEVFDPRSEGFTPTTPMRAGRASVAATLTDGLVLVTGYSDGMDSGTGAELFDPGREIWVATGTMASPRKNHAATLLDDEGHVLVSGGVGATEDLVSAETYDPKTLEWTPTMPMKAARSLHTATLLEDGFVLAVGGVSSAALGSLLDSAELFDPRQRSWSYVERRMHTPRSDHTATRLLDGRVLVVGGVDGTSSLKLVELFDRRTRTWTLTTDLSTARFGHTATLLGNSCVLVAGGIGAGSDLSSAELFDPQDDTWTPTPRMNFARVGHTATLLDDGRVLMAGGAVNQDAPTVAELFTLLPAGAACSARCECQSGTCVEGVCCDGDCDLCSLRHRECSPFACAPETGECTERCASIADCAQGYACDLSGNCVSSTPDPSFLDDSSCGISPPQPARSASGWPPGLGLLSLALMAALRRSGTALRD
ncbi:kelch repeat-containing protein [Sorangium sp. So ce388]|uniref:kelch repeat-containing protein n=1 Tax=Sorangium sp. So ce388 TaxID=3133309 RepID=UPI003F5AF2D3